MMFILKVTISALLVFGCRDYTGNYSHEQKNLPKIEDIEDYKANISLGFSDKALTDLDQKTINQIGIGHFQKTYKQIKESTANKLDSTMKNIRRSIIKKSSKLLYLAEYGSHRSIRSMAVIGDSISTGIFADTRMGTNYKLFLDLNFLFVDNIRLEPLTVIGSSLEKLLSGRFIFDLPSLQSLYVKDIHEQVKKQYLKMAIFSSENPYSHSSRIGLTELDILNLSVAGYKAKDMRSKALKKLGNEDYIILQIGANDLCHYETIGIEKFSSEFRMLVSEIYNRKKKPLILVVPAPDMNSVYEMTKNRNAFSAEISFPILGIGKYTYHFESVSCPQIRGELGDRDYLLCPIFKNYDANRVRQRQQTMNKIMKRTIDSIDVDSRIFFAEEVSRPGAITEDMFAIDCFHPNQKGQEKIANTAWMIISDKIRIRRKGKK